MTKKIITVMLILLLAMTLVAGCGKQGPDGKVFVSLSWAGLPLSWWSNIPGVPVNPVGWTAYPTNPGSYNFSYTAWDGSMWSGIITITANPGKPAQMFSDGAAGTNRYYDIYLSSFGPSITGLTSPSMDINLAQTKKVVLPTGTTITSSGNAPVGMGAPGTTTAASSSIERIVDNDYIIILESHKIK